MAQTAQELRNKKKTKFAWFRYFECRNELFATQHQLVEDFSTNNFSQDDIKKCPQYLQNFINELYEKSKKQIECPICLEQITSDNLETRICGHNFHKSCSKKYSKQTIECPICRQ